MCAVRALQTLGRDCLGAAFTVGAPTAAKFGTREITLHTRSAFGNPFLDVECSVMWERPDGSVVTVHAFYDGGDAFKARAYCDAVGLWRWRSSSNHRDLDGISGELEVVNSFLKGKLRRHPDDCHQFAYDNGEWFLHIGDTGYRYLCDGEEYWREYIDQAALAGMTKIRSWFCLDRATCRRYSSTIAIA